MIESNRTRGCMCSSMCLLRMQQPRPRLADKRQQLLRKTTTTTMAPEQEKTVSGRRRGPGSRRRDRRRDTGATVEERGRRRWMLDGPTTTPWPWRPPLPRRPPASCSSSCPPELLLPCPPLLSELKRISLDRGLGGTLFDREEAWRCSRGRFIQGAEQSLSSSLFPCPQFCFFVRSRVHTVDNELYY